MLDLIARHRGAADLLIGGDFNLTVGWGEGFFCVPGALAHG
jgi:hypothetical protein